MPWLMRESHIKIYVGALMSFMYNYHCFLQNGINFTKSVGLLLNFNVLAPDKEFAWIAFGGIAFVDPLY